MDRQGPARRGESSRGSKGHDEGAPKMQEGHEEGQGRSCCRCRCRAGRQGSREELSLRARKAKQEELERVKSRAKSIDSSTIDFGTLGYQPSVADG